MKTALLLVAVIVAVAFAEGRTQGELLDENLGGKDPKEVGERLPGFGGGLAGRRRRSMFQEQKVSNYQKALEDGVLNFEKNVQDNIESLKEDNLDIDILRTVLDKLDGYSQEAFQTFLEEQGKLIENINNDSYQPNKDEEKAFGKLRRAFDYIQLRRKEAVKNAGPQ